MRKFHYFFGRPSVFHWTSPLFILVVLLFGIAALLVFLFWPVINWCVDFLWVFFVHPRKDVSHHKEMVRNFERLEGKIKITWLDRQMYKISKNKI